MVAIVLAAGRSERLAAALPKPFLPLAGRPVLEHSLLAFASSTVDAVVVVLPASRKDELAAGLLAFPKVMAVTDGGPNRQDSLACGMAALPPEMPEDAVVVVHDAARPMVTPAVIEAVVAGVAGSFDGALAAIPLDDALKDVTPDGEVTGPRSRVGLWRAQTPQGFRRACLSDSLARVLAEGVTCDDCSEMATRAGYRVRVVPGDPRNIKVTRPEDLDLCERLLARPGR